MKLAFLQLDDLHKGELSHARSSRDGSLVKADRSAWAQEHAAALCRIISWTWRLRAKSGKSYDADIQNLKDSICM